MLTSLHVLNDIARGLQLCMPLRLQVEQLLQTLINHLQAGQSTRGRLAISSQLYMSHGPVARMHLKVFVSVTYVESRVHMQLRCMLRDSRLLL
jgi:hypothetical protein